MGAIVSTGARAAIAAFNLALTLVLAYVAHGLWSRSGAFLSSAGGFPPREAFEAGHAAVLAWFHATSSAFGPWAMAKGYLGAWVSAVASAGCGWLALLGARTVILTAFRALSRLV